MARLQTCQSSCYSLLLVGDNELAGRAPTKDRGTNTPTPAISHIPTFAPGLVLLRGVYTNVDLQKAIKLTLKLFF